MSEITFDQLLEATRRLRPDQRQALVQVLRLVSFSKGAGDPYVDPLVDGEVLNEAGAYSVFAPLATEHHDSGNISDADLLAASQCISCEWEEEIF